MQPLKLFAADVCLPKTSWKAAQQLWPAAVKHRSPKLTGWVLS